MAKASDPQGGYFEFLGFPPDKVQIGKDRSTTEGGHHMEPGDVRFFPEPHARRLRMNPAMFKEVSGPKGTKEGQQAAKNPPKPDTTKQSEQNKAMTEAAQKIADQKAKEGLATTPAREE